jgi:hypothetical protein
MSFMYQIPLLPATIAVIAFLIVGMSGTEARADETGVQSGFEEHRVEFHNQNVKLAGSLLCQEAKDLFRPLSLSMAQAHKLGSRTVRRVNFSRDRVLPH